MTTDMGREVLITCFGEPSVLQVRTAFPKVPRQGEIRVRVRAAGIAFADVKMRHGVYPGAPKVPFAPGYDVAGVVDAVGPGVTRFKTGDRVAALTFVGGYSDFAIAREDRAAPIPDGVEDAKATAAVLNYITALQMLERFARLREGNTILVHGAAGGVGTALLDLARSRRLKAFGTASAGKHDTVRALGGAPIDYRAEDFVKVLREAGGAHAAFDHIGGSHMWRSRRALRRGGTLVTYGFASAVGEGRGEKKVIRQTFINLALMRLIPGKRSRFYAILTKPFDAMAHLSEDLATLMRLLAAGQIDPKVGLVLPLDQAAEAHRALEGAEVEGKIVLTP